MTIARLAARQVKWICGKAMLAPVDRTLPVRAAAAFQLDARRVGRVVVARLGVRIRVATASSTVDRI
jgi:hypothetical protein